MHPYDVIFTGLAFDIAAALVLVRGLVFKDLQTAYHEGLAPSGGNSLIIKNALVQRAEAIVGTLALFFGFVLQMWGNLHGGATASELGWVNSMQRFLIVMAGAGAITWAAALAAAHFARVQFFKFWMRNYEPGSELAPTNRDDPTWLDRTARLVDLKRKAREPDAAFLKRIEEKRLKLGARYGGHHPGFRVR